MFLLKTLTICRLYNNIFVDSAAEQESVVDIDLLR